MPKMHGATFMSLKFRLLSEDYQTVNSIFSG